MRLSVWGFGMEPNETISGNDIDMAVEIGGAYAALFSTGDGESGSAEVHLSTDQYDAIVGTSAFANLSIEAQIGFFTGSIAAGFALASLVLITKLAIGAIRTLLQRI